jgi:ribosomal protein S18 acetylase RimI-like enzyme
MDYLIRPLTSQDEPVLWEMVYVGLQSGRETSLPSREILKGPDLARYVEGWGRPGDAGFVAHEPESGKPLGAIWCRPSYAHEQPEGAAAIPEVAWAVHPQHRRRGIGAALMTQWVKANPQQSAVTLAVPANNPAVRLYERFGFKVAREEPRSVVMRREL